MSRPYSDKFLRELSRSESDGLGVELARLCVDANLSAAHIAIVLDVSRTTVYSWFRGQGVRERKRKEVEALISLLKKDMHEQLLPVLTPVEGKKYIESLIGVKI